MRAARDLESLAIVAQVGNIDELVMRLDRELGALQKAEAAERSRTKAKREAEAAEKQGRDSLLATIDAIRQESDLAFFTNKEREREIILRQAAKDAIGLEAGERKKLLEFLNEELDRRADIDEKLEESTEKANALALQTSDIVRGGIADSIADYENLGDVAEGVFEQIRQAAIRAAVAAAFGPQGSLFSFGGGGGSGAPETALGAAFGSSGNVLPGLARGGVISEPGLLSTRQGMRSVAEGGRPEAVMPLARGPGGRLGVEAAGGGSQTLVMNISGVTDADSFRRSERQILAKARRGLNRRGE